ncbi:ATP-dependent exoDNAse (exonuclease V), alpha subunit/helicase superfamily I member (plasmid) [Synechococcus sp. PCC 7502]|uniref:SF1B family DNA helicase RecD2 n=1 Tax=Synechococcus sp. PCC 7502 TaxID=1173263 RepID=UPI00029FD752|nr:ATP-dependent RecD-like DNA helicase [Synechococcus sp. PCC 7502]AFY75429.1 ATP-dependent exoDNAse (exonuclease V), alpha subunit/helicase superfamily I member [Synechococcus sp. PCC 7502]
MPDKTDYLQGVIERLTFHSEETGYAIARLKTPKSPDLITIVGNFANIQAGQTLALEGIWRSHPKYGDQFQVSQYQETKPATLTGIEKYLGSGLIKGVGPVTAKRIVAHFGLDTLDIIENQIDRLIEVPGIAKKRVKMIQTAWSTQKSIKEVMVFLQGHSVSTTYAVKIYKTYGNDSISTVTENPYKLATDIYGIGFFTADAIARNIGIEISSEFRSIAGIFHSLGEAGEEGHCYLPQSELIERTVKLLTLEEYQPDPNSIEALTHKLAINDQLIMQGDYQGQFICYKPSIYHTEKGLAERIYQLLQHKITVDMDRVNNWIDRYTAHQSITLSAQQRQAVEMAATSSILILTGGPGTGKTTTTRTIVALWKAMGKEIALASPTGRAAQRLQEVTGCEAKTLHRYLEFDPSSMGFKRNQDYPLTAKAIAVDEASMLDIFLAFSLIKAIPIGTQLLLIGDTDQLPSVGAGNVLKDLIDSQHIPVITLTEVFRQAQASQIIQNAHRINTGKYPQIEKATNQPQTDCLYLEMPTAEAGVQGICDLITHLIPNLGFNPQQDMQVLCPMTRGDVGTRNLNQVLQQLLNPPDHTKPEIKRGSTIFRLGDRIMQQVNDYNREVFNGDIGTITGVDLEEQEITVIFGDRQVTYDSADLNEITLARATTIHKAQGSEYPVVIIPMFMQHFLMLSRNLFYTGITRAKKLAIIVGESKAIGLAVKQVNDRNRYTYLARRISKLANLE